MDQYQHLSAYNKRHHHIDRHIIFSGVYYVTAPEDSGCLKFYDPRGSMIAEDAALGISISNLRNLSNLRRYAMVIPVLVRA